MAWSLQAGASVTGSVASLVPGMPASVSAGDLLIVVLTVRGAATTSSATGYTQFYTDQTGGDTIFCLKKTAVGGDTSPTVTHDGFAQDCATIIRVSGWDTAGGPAQMTNNTSTTTTASITPPTAGSLKIAVVHSAGSGGAFGVTWTVATEIAEVYLGPRTGNSIAYKEEDTAGALAFTYTGTPTPGTLIFSLAPAAAVSTFVPRVVAVY